MSSKFNSRQNLQGTPKVCKKGPTTFPVGTFDFAKYPLQAFASWHDPFSPLDGAISGQTELTPFPGLDLHFGTIEGNPNYLEIDLIWNPLTNEFGLVVQLLLGLAVLDSVQVNFAEPQPGIPFETELFLFEDPTHSRRVQCKIMS